MPSAWFRRKCTLTIRTKPIREGEWRHALVEEKNVQLNQELPRSMLSDVLENLPPCFVLPVGGTRCASLALFSSFCLAVRAAQFEQHVKMGESCLMSVLPTMINDPAPRAALLGLFAKRYNSKFMDFASWYSAKPSGVNSFGFSAAIAKYHHRTLLLENLLPILDEIVTDLWVVYRCQERAITASSKYEHEYLGKYSRIREGSREGAEAFTRRVSLMVTEYQRKVLRRAISRRQQGLANPESGDSWDDEVVLPNEQKKLLKKVDSSRIQGRNADAELALANLSAGVKEAANDRDIHQLHTPFNTRELLGGFADV